MPLHLKYSVRDMNFIISRASHSKMSVTALMSACASAARMRQTHLYRLTVNGLYSLRGLNASLYVINTAHLAL